MSVSMQFQKDNLWKVVYCSHGGRNLYKAKQFAQWLAGSSLAALTVVSAVETGLSITEERSGDYGHIGLHAMVHIRSVDNGVLYGVVLPAPDVSVFNSNQEVLPEWGIECAAKYSIMAGSTFTFESGALCGSSV